MPQLQLSALGALVVSAALFDLRFRRIPNWLNAAGWLLGIGLQIAAHGATGAKQDLLGSGLALAVYTGLFALRAMGAGDVKLMAAVGAFTGPVHWLYVFLLASVIGGVIALVAVLSKGALLRVARTIAFLVWDLVHFRAPFHAHPELDVGNEKARTLPHGVAIALGTLLYEVLFANAK